MKIVKRVLISLAMLLVSLSNAHSAGMSMARVSSVSSTARMAPIARVVSTPRVAPTPKAANVRGNLANTTAQYTTLLGLIYLMSGPNRNHCDSKMDFSMSKMTPVPCINVK